MIAAGPSQSRWVCHAKPEELAVEANKRTKQASEKRTSEQRTSEKRTSEQRTSEKPKGIYLQPPMNKG